MTTCDICSVFSNRPKVQYDDCILELIENIKIHYNRFKKDFKETKSLSEKLQIENIELRQQIVRLERKVSAYSCSPVKKRKTNSLENRNIDSRKNIQKESDDDIGNDLNKAINMSDIDWSESFSPVEENKENTPKKKSSPRKVLSPLDNIPSPTLNKISSPPLLKLPKRLKVASSKKDHSDDQKSKSGSNWISVKGKDQPSMKAVSRNLGMSFIQPHQPSPKISKKVESPPTDESKRTLLNLPIKQQNKLRQTTLQFDIVTNNYKEESTPADCDETFCDEFVEPSPIPEIKQEEISKMKKRNLSKILHKKSDDLFPFTLKKSKPRALSLNKSGNSTGKRAEKNKKIEIDTDSSVQIIPNNPDDDVIVIDNTDIDYTKFNAEDLINEMMTECDIPTYVNLNDIKKDKNSTVTELEKRDKEFEEIIKTGCQDCQNYFKSIGRNLPLDEIKTRLRNCKHKDLIAMNSTPEGFWDPIFHPFSEDDPRNETLIDDRFLIGKDKKTT